MQGSKAKIWIAVLLGLTVLCAACTRRPEAAGTAPPEEPQTITLLGLETILSSERDPAKSETERALQGYRYGEFFVGGVLSQTGLVRDPSGTGGPDDSVRLVRFGGREMWMKPGTRRTAF